MKWQLLLWLTVFTPIILLVNGAIVFAIIKKIRELWKPEDQAIEFVVLGETSESFETFLALTFDLESIRKQINIKQLTDEEKTEIMNDLDVKLGMLQETLIHIQSGGIPNPDVLTKRYVQELTLQTLVIRILYEKLSGRFIQEAPETEANIVKISQAKNTQ